MSGLLESAMSILRLSSARLGQVSENVGNVSTPGYKRSVAYRTLQAALDAEATAGSYQDATQGKLQATGASLDVAIEGAGAFELRDGEQLVQSRVGQFHRVDDGRLADGRGRIVQDAGGGDVVLARDDVTILPDGTILDGQRPVARIAVRATDGSEPSLRQAMVEASNVTLGDEMLSMMTAMREAEGGARLVQVYDELMGRALTVLGQAGR
ncbi:flagellar basal body rod C-terminal domain-containing protein [Sphingomonas hankookensis]|uniref:flagellar basal body rod C-terminal domain-containing protein n=1 Tax=Sphingomonas hankookensis TaxID=563996 RepID=UPI001F59AFB4|nr:flagellar basal body rod C-terminal domain-containing protein [Sphingomonas hankookensis]